MLLILSDQHRATSLGAYGNAEVSTPHLDRMAAEGRRFTACVAMAPICAPSRSSLQTGRYPHQHGVTRNGEVVRPGSHGVAHDLTALGYDTVYIGKSHWSGAGRPGAVAPKDRLGWSRWLGFNRGHYYYDPPVFNSDDESIQGEPTHVAVGRFEPEWQVDRALEFMSAVRQPWAMQINFGPPHTATLGALYQRTEIRERMLQLNRVHGFGLPEQELLARPESWFPQSWLAAIVPESHLKRYDANTLTLQPNVAPELEALARQYYHEYYALISAVDEQVGRLLDSVRGTDTVVIYTSDHGDQLGSHTTLPTGLQAGMPEQGTRVNKGRAKGRPLQNSYRVPLIAWAPDRLAGDETIHTPVGTLDLRPGLVSLAGGIPDPDLPGTDFLADGFAAHPRLLLLGLEDWRAIFDGRYFYAAALRDGRLSPHRLVDTRDDPYDMHDLMQDPRHAAARRRLTEQLRERLRAVADPLGGPT